MKKIRMRGRLIDCLRILTSIIAFFPNVAGKVNSFIACYSSKRYLGMNKLTAC